VNVFLAGVPADLAEIEAMVAILPICSYGQIVVESDEVLPVLSLPRRMQIRRVPVAVDPLTGEPAAGESLSRAVDGWIAEWMPSSSSGSSFYAWVGCEGGPIAREAAQRIEHTLHAALSN
jgi:hypothetical protein